jgi:uncharacterized BrkB/YihY/UPF0761 family membrane protein
MQAKVVLSLTATVVLCLPSLLGGLALLANLLLQRHLEDWGQTSAASVALGVFIGGPLVAIAAVMGLLVASSYSFSPKVKSGHLIIVSLGAIATISLLFRFVVSHSP